MGSQMIGKLQPDTQLDNLNLYKDDILEADVLGLAEVVGTKVLGYSSGLVQAGTLDEFEDTTSTPFSALHEDFFIVVSGSSNGNDGAYQISGFSSTSKVLLRTSLAAAETGLTYGLYRNPSLEDDINYVITQLSEIIGNPGAGKKWNNNMPRAFDPSDTDGSNTKNEKIDLNILAANWYGSKTKILRNVHFDNQSVSVGALGKLITSTRPYATPADRTGGILGAYPIFKSVANAGSYYDEASINAICKVNVIDTATGDEFFNSSGYVVFGKLYDGADYHPSALGDGSCVYVRFYQDDGSNAGLGSVYTWASGDPLNVRLELPVRKRRTDILEHEEYAQFIGSTLGDAETAQDIAQIRNALGLADGDMAGDFTLTNTDPYFPFNGLTLATATLEDIVNILNQEIGDRQYTDNNVIDDGETITESLDKLDMAIGSGAKTKIIERVSGTINKNSEHLVPFASGSNGAITTYKIDDSNFGRYMDIFVNGQKLIPHISDVSRGHYMEVDNGAGTGTKIIFKFTISANETIEYLVKDDA